MIVKSLHANSAEGQKAIDVLLARFETGDDSCARSVAEIIEAVKNGGDDAVLSYAEDSIHPAWTWAP
jgi:histidinol dehydrogenase